MTFAGYEKMLLSFAYVSFAFASRAAGLEQMLNDRLRAQGLSLGYDRKSDQFVCVGVGKSELAGEGVRADALVRCRGLAELSAKASVVAFIRARTDGTRLSAFSDDGGGGQRDIGSSVELLAHDVLVGENVVETVEEIDGKTCSVAVAMAWSRSAAERWQRSLDGDLPFADAWRDELDAHLRTSDVSTWRTHENFVDSAGAIHPVGIGRYSPAEDDLSTEAERRVAVAAAGKNLLLSLYGNSLVCECARKMRRTRHRRIAEGKMAVDAWSEEDYRSLASVTWQGPVPPGVALLCERRLPSEGTGRGEVIVVVGFGAPPGKDIGAPSPAKRPACGGGGLNVKVYNPRTGRFE